jgi:hypothetical protein
MRSFRFGQPRFDVALDHAMVTQNERNSLRKALRSQQDDLAQLSAGQESCRPKKEK